VFRAGPVERRRVVDEARLAFELSAGVFADLGTVHHA